jgi:hypothetical protein
MIHRKTFFALVLSAASLTNPCALFAQHGGGGGHIGGSAAGGGGLSSGNRATGVQNKDDLRDFHQIMAVQASREQKIAYAAMVKSTALAAAELQGFQEQARKESNLAAVALADKNLADALDTARTLNKKFVEGFSEAQKSGLKEMIKRLGKADLELGQESRVLDQSFEMKASSAQIAGAAEGLGRALTAFQREQSGLGEEMSIESASASQESAYNLPALRNTVNVSGQNVLIDSSGIVSKAAAENGQNVFAVELTADLTDLQHSFTDVLRGLLNQSDRCGEHIEVLSATLIPQQASSLAQAQLHYERWTCTTMFGRENQAEIVEGNATIYVTLSPYVAGDGTLRQKAEMSRVEADGLLRDALVSGSLSERLSSRISDAVLSAMSQGADFKSSIPPEARPYVALKQARFQGTGSGRLLALMVGEILVPNENLAAVAGALQQQSTAAAQSAARPELLTR